jgi:uncharacterized protein
VTGWLAAGFASAWLATMPNPGTIGAPPALGGEVVDAVTTTADGITVRGWLATATGGTSRCVVLAAGIRGNRLAMVERARWYVARGWSALLVDLRGTGASEPTRISFGWHEANDLTAWFHWLAARGFTRIGAHGQSLGAAAIVYGAARPDAPQWAFAVLEASYGDIGATLANRLPVVPWPRFTLLPLHESAEWLAAIDGDALRPLDAIRALRIPTLLACGDRDDKVGAGVSEALLAGSAATEKQLVLVPGAGHVDLWTAGTPLRDALAAFLASR